MIAVSTKAHIQDALKSCLRGVEYKTTAERKSNGPPIINFPTGQAVRGEQIEYKFQHKF